MKTPSKPTRGDADAAVYRTRQLATIHQAKKQLGLDDEVYRSILQRVASKASSASMTSAERKAVIDELVRLGYVPPVRDATRGFPGRPKRTDEVPMVRKVEALLADAKRPWRYAHAMAKRMFERERLEFLQDDELHRLVQALEIDARRRARK